MTLQRDAQGILMILWTSHFQTAPQSQTVLEDFPRSPESLDDSRAAVTGTRVRERHAEGHLRASSHCFNTRICFYAHEVVERETCLRRLVLGTPLISAG